MIEVGIDTSVLIALLDPKDVWHAPAVELKQSLQATGRTWLFLTVCSRKQSALWPRASTSSGE